MTLLKSHYLPKIVVRLAILLSAITFPVQAFADSEPVFGVPLFHFKSGDTQCAGKAFAIQWFKNRKILLMPLHLVGPGAGMSYYILPQDVPNLVESVDVLNFKHDQVLTTAKPGLLRTGCPVEKSTTTWSEDLMAFELPSNNPLTLFPLYPDLVKVGTRVWILSKGDDLDDSNPDRYAGTVTISYETGVTIKMDSSLTALSSSGAPVVNDKNELVAMVVGKVDPDRRMYITAIASSMLYKKLYRELSH
jgi:hypothetical protein